LSWQADKSFYISSWWHITIYIFVLRRPTSSFIVWHMATLISFTWHPYGFHMIRIYQVVYNASLYNWHAGSGIENNLNECTPMRSKRSVTEVDMTQLAVLVWWSIKIFSQRRAILPCIRSNLSLCMTLSIQQWWQDELPWKILEPEIDLFFRNDLLHQHSRVDIGMYTFDCCTRYFSGTYSSSNQQHCNQPVSSLRVFVS